VEFRRLCEEQEVFERESCLFLGLLFGVVLSVGMVLDRWHFLRGRRLELEFEEERTLYKG
jgi:hypothetical protein